MRPQIVLCYTRDMLAGYNLFKVNKMNVSNSVSDSLMKNTLLGVAFQFKLNLYNTCQILLYNW